MSIYRNQAQRVIDFIVKESEIPEKALKETLNISVGKIEKTIQEMVGKRHGGKIMNGVEAANMLIETWKRSSPTYIQDAYKIVHIHEGIEFRFKVLENEFHVFMHGTKGDYLENFQLKFVDEEDFKTATCAVVLDNYRKKTENL